ncbi:class B sortase [Pseudobutyrivibrio xylanivorans]|nr:class B sortase [Pseudobutyrivibrio xylanivorans]
MLKPLGNLIIALIIIACIPLAVPKLLGFSEFNVISGSMEPAISVGSLVYVKPADFNELSEKDVIAYEAGASVVTHRIVEIDKEQLLFTTKGDANGSADFMPVAYTNVIGKVIFHIPVLGYVAAILAETLGKIGAALLLLVGLLLSNLGDNNIEGKHSENRAVKRHGIDPKIILALGLLIVFSSIGGIIYIYSGYQKSEKIYENLQANYTTVAAAEAEGQWYDELDVDIASLQKINPQVIGWLYVEGTDISYPIMFSGDDEKYLRRTIDNEYAKAGSIFLEGFNYSDWSDSHNIIYGHNMRNLSMFGKLKYYKSDDDYYEEHKYFQIITSDGKRRYEIFSYFDTEPGSWVYTVPFYPDDEYKDYINQLVSHSYVKSERTSQISETDQVVTLSTCSASEMRFTVHGVLCDTQGL